MINKDEMDGLGLADAAMVSLVKRREAMTKRIENLEKAIREGQQQLEESKNDLTSTSLGLFYVMERVLVELQKFVVEHVDGIHADVLGAVQNHNDVFHAPMSYTVLKMALHPQYGEDGEFSLSLMTTVNDLIENRLLMRGGDEHDKNLKGNLWTAVTDLRASVEHVTKYLRDVRDTVKAVEALGNVTPLWPRHNA